MAHSNHTVLNVANALLRQRKPEILQEYANRVATFLSEYPLINSSNPAAVHQYQGDGTNHCGPTTLAMVINLILQDQGYSGSLVKFNDLQAAMQNGSLGFGLTGYRLGKTTLLQKLRIAPNITGATLPWGLAQAFIDFNEGLIRAGGPDLGTVSFAEDGTKQDLLDNIKHGYYTAIMLVWPNNQGAHWIAITGYRPATDEFEVLDPANAKGGLKTMAWTALEEHWSRPIGITNLPDLPFIDEENLIDLLTLENVIITFQPPQSGQEPS
jgi:hypothetical protein